MGVKGGVSGRSSRRVSLLRPGSKEGAAKNSRREQNTPAAPGRFRSFSIPWRSAGRCLSAAAIAIALLVFVAGISFVLTYGYRLLTTSSYFAVTTVEIRGNSRISSREILEVADLVKEGNILALSIDAIEDDLFRNPWVEELSVKRILPGTLVIGVKEKVPAFWLLHEGKLHYADILGRIIAPLEPGKFASLPMLEVESGAEDATAALPDLLKSLKESRLPLNVASLSWIRLSAARGMEIYIDDRNLKISIDLEEWLPNLERLSRTLADLERRGEMSSVREIRTQGSNVWVEKGSAGGAGV
jgi:cell division protein FtsQ